MRAVDTNVLVRLIVRDDDEQASAADEFVAAGAWVPHLVLAEALWVLTSVYAQPLGTGSGRALGAETTRPAGRNGWCYSGLYARILSMSSRSRPTLSDASTNFE